MYHRNAIQHLKDSLDIVDVISSRINLKKTGKNYSALCPFHNEKSPSFNVIQSKQFYHCFGCGASGDVIKFIQEHDNLSFVRAVEYLEKLAGINLEKTDDKIIPKKLLDIIKEDKAIIFIANQYKEQGIKMLYSDKQRLKLALARLEGVKQKYGA
jgi:DNA primase